MTVPAGARDAGTGAGEGAGGAGAGDDVPVRDAATVVLLRDGTSGVEVWMLTRVAAMTFAAGMSVFPGGRVEPADADLPVVGDVAALAARFGTDERTALSFAGGAARETFEETGVLLTSAPVDLRAQRAAVEAGEVSFGQLLREHGVAVDLTGLVPWSRWVTPRGEVRRYDTRFFLAALPDGAVADDVTTESSAASWLPVGTVLEQGARGERRLLPPTAVTLASLLPYPTVAEALAASAGRDLEPVRPRLRIGDDGTVSVTLPDGSVMELPPGRRP